MTQKGMYITQRDHSHYDSSKLQIYIDSLDKKIQGAKWKQNLILTYNYMPLEMAKQKIAQQKQQYLKRLSKMQSKLQVQTKNQQTQSQVQLFRDFGEKLMNRIKEIQQRMDGLKMQMIVLKASVQQKKQSLSYLLKQNVHLNKMLIQEHNKILYTEQPIKQKHNIQSTTSSRTQQFPLKTLRALSQFQKDTPKSTKYSVSTSSNWRKTDDLFQQCVETTIKSLKNMNASQDVQAGIYLQIMNRKIPIKAATFSLKSKTCDVLMDRYKDLKNRKPKDNDDFVMSQSTFLSLNWKQIMGIILVKDRNATKLRQLLKFLQDQN